MSEKISKVSARQGEAMHRVRYVLVFSTGLAVVSMIAVSLVFGG